MNFFKNIPFIVVALLLSIVAQAKEMIYFSHYSNYDGLLSNRILYMSTDNQGYLWVSTDFGLSRFDGKRFKSYTTKEYPDLMRDDIMSVQCYGDKKVMVGGRDGMLYEYDKEKDVFIDKMPAYFNETFYRTLTKFYLSEQGQLYSISDNGGAFLYDEQSGTFTEKHPYFEKSQYTLINSLYKDPYDRLWCGSLDYFQVIDREGKEVFTYHSENQPCGVVSSIVGVDNQHVLVSSTLGELWIFEIDGEKIVGPKVLKVPFASTSNVLKDSRGCFWFTTDGYGLWKSETLQENDFQEIVPINASKMDISKIYAIQEGRDGTIWIGTQNKGIWGISRKENVPLFFSGEIGFPLVLCSCFEKDEDGNLYIGTDGAGLYKVDGKFKQVVPIELPNKNITGMCKLPNHSLALSTWGKGVIYYNYKENKSSIENFKGLDDPSHNFFGISYQGNSLYACSAGDGMYVDSLHLAWKRLNMEDTSKQCGNKWVLCSMEGTNGLQWTLTTNSLVCRKNGQFISLFGNLTEQKMHNQLSVTDATCLDSGELVLVTNKGVLFIHTDFSIDTLDKVPQHKYMSVQVDDNGKVWASYIGGVLYFNPYTQEYSEISKDFSDMSKYFFMNRSKYKTPEGIILFGSNGGFVSIDTKQTFTESNIDYLAFSQLFLNHDKVMPCSELLPKGNLNSNGKLVLKYNQTNISIGVDCLDYDEMMPVSLQYRLSGYSDEWQKVDENRLISFNHIPEGKYVLEVMAYRTNPDQKNLSISLPIIVKSPWWKSLWFSICMFLLFVAAVIALLRIRTRRLEKAKQNLTEMVNLQTNELRCSLQEKNRILSVIAHDLKNPMFAISSALKNWTEKGVQSATDSQVELVYDTSLRLQDEMQKLLDWAKSGQDNIAWNPQNCNLYEIVENVLSLLKKQIEDKQLQIDLEMSNTSHYVYADVRSLEIIIRNLISNAVKFTSEGGSITVSTEESNDQSIIRVKDSGVGMSTEQVQNLLQKGLHNSTDGTNGEKGTGLGISLCDNYIRRNFGHMDIESEVGKGTTITIVLPMSNDKIVPVEIKNTVGADTIKDTEILEGNTILWVDDEPLICDSMQENLSRYATIVTAHNGLEALQVLKSTRVDLIVTDVSMPQMDGLEFVKTVKKNKEFSHLPILFVSANSDENDRLLGLKSGAVDYINKPFVIEEVLLKLSNILLMRQKIQQHLLQAMMISKGEVKKETEESDKVAEQKDEMLNPDLRRFMKILEEKYADPALQTEGLASEMMMSLSTLFRKIKSLTGKTPVDLLNEYRLNKAMQYLANPQDDTPIAEIALKCGFSDASYFSKKFKDQYNISPSQYRQKI